MTEEIEQLTALRSQMLRALWATVAHDDRGPRLHALLEQLYGPSILTSASRRHSSGLTASGTPLEASLKVQEGTVALRCTVDPDCPTETSGQAARAAIRMLGGAPALKSLTPILDVFALDTADFYGNFRIWLGGGLDADLRPSLKLYLNPSLADPADPLIGAMRIAATAGRASQTLDVLQRLLDTCGPFVSQVVGLNVDWRGRVQLKIYVVLPAPSPASLSSFAGGHKGLKARLDSVMPSLRQRAPVHVAVSTSLQEATRAQVSLQLHSDWWDSRSEAAKVADKLMSREGLSPKSTRIVSLTDLNVTFIGVGQTATYVYVSPPLDGAMFAGSGSTCRQS